MKIHFTSPNSISLFLILSFCIMALHLNAQVRLAPDFVDLLDQVGLQYFSPVEDSFKSFSPGKNKVLTSNMAIKSKKKDLEIRYAIRHTKKIEYPHINSFNMASHVASNEEDTNVAVHQIPEKDLKEIYNADWGAIFYFKPKKSFSPKQFCKMLVLYGENKASVYAFYLFDKIDDDLEHQLYQFRFEE